MVARATPCRTACSRGTRTVEGAPVEVGAFALAVGPRHGNHRPMTHPTPRDTTEQPRAAPPSLRIRSHQKHRIATGDPSARIGRLRHPGRGCLPRGRNTRDRSRRGQCVGVRSPRRLRPEPSRLVPANPGRTKDPGLATLRSAGGGAESGRKRQATSCASSEARRPTYSRSSRRSPGAASVCVRPWAAWCSSSMGTCSESPRLKESGLNESSGFDTIPDTAQRRDRHRTNRPRPPPVPPGGYRAQPEGDRRRCRIRTACWLQDPADGPDGARK